MSKKVTKKQHITKLQKNNLKQPDIKENTKFQISTEISLLIILLLTAIVYLPTLKAGFVNWDDTKYITYNPYIQSLGVENIKNIFTSFWNCNYHPLTILSYAIDYSLVGEKPFLYHLVNIIFHLLNTVLVYKFIDTLFLMINKGSVTKYNFIIPAISALLFGIHPMHVESVSWVSERKDVLYTFFFLLALIQYLQYVNTKKISRYYISIVLFLLSLFSKGMAVSFPLSIIAIDYVLTREWRSKRVIFEKIPFIIIAVIFGIIALKAQESMGAVTSGSILPLKDRISYACYAFFQYISKLFVPVNLSHYYPYPFKSGEADLTKYYNTPFFLFIGLALYVLIFRKQKVMLFGLLFFIVNIILVIKIIPVGDTYMADRYTYISSIGIFILIAIFFKYVLLNFKKMKVPVVVVLIVYSIFLGYQTYVRTIVWNNTLNLWEDAARKYPKNGVVFLWRGVEYENSGNLDAAITDLEYSLRIDPYNPIIQAEVERLKVNISNKIEEYNRIISSNPNNSTVLCNRGKLLCTVGKYSEALIDLNMAIAIEQSLTEAFQNRGTVYFFLKDYQNAINDFSTVIKQRPNHVLAYYSRGSCFTAINNKKQACKDFQTAANLNYQPAKDALQDYCK
ncbi:MAG: tetratricopeptide repeat protein [Bacteroidales bacterium]